MPVACTENLRHHAEWYLYARSALDRRLEAYFT